MKQRRMQATPLQSGYTIFLLSRELLDNPQWKLTLVNQGNMVLFYKSWKGNKIKAFYLNIYFIKDPTIIIYGFLDLQKSQGRL
jgi:hypothetical protein